MTWNLRFKRLVTDSIVCSLRRNDVKPEFQSVCTLYNLVQHPRHGISMIREKNMSMSREGKNKKKKKKRNCRVDRANWHFLAMETRDTILCRG